VGINIADAESEQGLLVDETQDFIVGGDADREWKKSGGNDCSVGPCRGGSGGRDKWPGL
jgi:hypothetical protein